MNVDLSKEIAEVPQDPRVATKYVVDLLVYRICPILQKLRTRLRCLDDQELQEEIAKIRNVFLLSSSQIQKCVINFFDVIKMEEKHDKCLQESRKFIFDRLSWCLTKLSTVEQNLDRLLDHDTRQDLSDDSMFVTPMYFVNWIDYTFEILSKLAENVYRTDYKDNNAIYTDWKVIMVENITSLHMCIDELLLAAMTLCKYCLLEDQTVLKARCQVVLRETKALFNELINDDISATVKVTQDNLKLPIKPSNVNILIDVLKDVLYVLETNTNTALLALLIHCYVNCSSPVDILKDHFVGSKDHSCTCSSVDESNIEKCTVVEDFDLYYERLVQIGSFAVSCSSDQKRILTLRSCLSSLEALDPHLVPAVMTTPDSHHTSLLINIWKQEVLEIRDTVFLIVDPVAFVEKCKQYMHDLLLGIRKQDSHDYHELWIAMNTGIMVYDFFMIYKKCEPDAIPCYEELDKLLNNLNRAQKECKTVSRFFTADGKVFSGTEVKINHHKITFGNLMTRIKLLYSIVKKIHELLHPKDNDDQLFEDEEVPAAKNLTQTVNNGLTAETYNCQRKPGVNLTRSMFARTNYVQSSTRNVFLSKLTKHLKVRKGLQEELSFSAQVSELFDFQKEKKTFPSENLSLRKALFSKCEYPFMKQLNNTFDVKDERGSQLLDGSASLQISEILKQINDITTTFATPKKTVLQKTTSNKPLQVKLSGSVELVFDDTSSTANVSDASHPSNVTTLERISDLDLVESKLSSLRNTEFETHL